MNLLNILPRNSEIKISFSNIYYAYKYTNSLELTHEIDLSKAIAHYEERPYDMIDIPLYGDFKPKDGKKLGVNYLNIFFTIKFNHYRNVWILSEEPQGAYITMNNKCNPSLFGGSYISGYPMSNPSGLLPY